MKNKPTYEDLINQNNYLLNELSKYKMQSLQNFDLTKDIGFNELFNIEEIQKIQDLFAEVTGVASIITQPNGVPITKPSNFCRLCNDVIRKTEKGLKNCYHSDSIIGQQNETGPIYQPCLSGGLWDAGASITIEGKHLANWLIGQVKNETTDEAKMLIYAKEIGADEIEFKNSLDEIPSMSIDKFKKVADILFLIANELSTKAFQNIQQNRFISKLQDKEELLIQAKRKAQESVKAYKDVVETSTDLITVVDATGKLIFVNHASIKFWGLSPEECIGKLAFAFIHPDDIDYTISKFNELIKSNINCFHIENRQVSKNGSILNVSWNINLERSGNKILKITSLARDITEQKEIENELRSSKEKAEESNRLKSAFLANMSHEIRTPMNGILGFAELLKKPKLTGEQQEKYISIIKKSGERMLNIINDIVDISKIESGQMTLVFKESNINEQLEYIHTFFKSEAETKGIKLVIKNNLPLTQAIAQTDREKVFAILTNLVKNAIKFTDQGSIEFGCKPNGALIEFFVKDTGIGIPKDRQLAIFDRFIQADIEDSRAFQGAGLGLSISKAYAEMLGGKMWVESEEGKGSEFYFTISYNLQHNEVNNIEDDVITDLANEQIRSLKILIVEDDETSKFFISEIVDCYCKEILYAGDGNEAIKACQNNPDIDLVLMDIQLPKMNGHEATKKIREFNKDVIIIAQTAFGLANDREKALESGCNDYISKPVQQDLLFNLLQKYFNEKIKK